jgi:hypothetical protein
MALVPSKPADKVQWYRNKTSATGKWKLNAVAIGSTVAIIDGVAADVDAAQAALDDVAAKKTALKTAVSEAKVKVAALSAAGADVIASIRSKAAQVGVSIWPLADLPDPTVPSPVPAPGTPEKFKAQLLEDGALKVSFKCPNPTRSQGTVYEVKRKTGLSGAWTALGTTGKREFTDEALTSSAIAGGSVIYQVTAIRSTRQGEPGTFLVQFGTAAGTGETIATVVSPVGSPKLAA